MIRKGYRRLSSRLIAVWIASPNSSFRALSKRLVTGLTVQSEKWTLISNRPASRDQKSPAEETPAAGGRTGAAAGGGSAFSGATSTVLGCGAVAGGPSTLPGETTGVPLARASAKTWVNKSTNGFG